MKKQKEKKKKFVYDHVKACKPFDVEELPDIYINRRISAPIVKLLLNTGVTPNQVTVISLFIGILGAVLLFNNKVSPMVSAFLIYLALILDCVDGQLARSRDQASLSGRIMDGMVDYLNTTSYFIAMVGFSLKNLGGNYSTLIWLLGAGAGLSTLVHSVLYDYYKNLYIAFAIKDYDESLDSIEEINNEYRDAKLHNEWSKIITLLIYTFYLKIQDIFISSSDKRSASGFHNDAFDEDYAVVYRRYHRKLTRAWSLLGPTAHVTVISVTSFIAAFDPRAFIYCFIVFTAIMNPYMLVTFLFQYRNSKKTKKN